MFDYDVLVVGGGIFGLTSAYYVKLHHPDLSVAIIEKERDVGQGNTARSVGGYRYGIFTSRVNQTLAETTIDHFRQAEAENEARLNMRNIGYLILLNENAFRRNAELLNYFEKTGRAKLLPPTVLHKELGLVTDFKGDEESKLMGVDNVVTGLYAPSCGLLDVEKVVELYKKRCIDSGVEIITGVKADRLLIEPETPLGIPNEPRAWQKTVVAGVETSKGVFKAMNMIIAAGAWTPELLDPIGVDCFVKPKKRQLFAVKAVGKLDKLLNVSWLGDRPFPMTFLPKGLYVAPRLNEKSFWVSLTDNIGRPFSIDYEPEPRFYYDNIYPLLVKYFPQFEGERPYNMWAGCYSMNNLDGNPIVFKFLNCVVVTGGSGSGVMKSDAVGRVVEGVLFDKEYVELHGGVKFDVSLIGIEKRNVDKEYFIL